ncbi:MULTISPECIES: hypothetical protein [unclassified Massilia]|uniref:hypothetical protein n=1 Tax=unclassified Massilia TaxID=2609279 RepID=UPI001B833BCE|nr:MULTISPECIES: hypothetical protein [unclassified Massilia]MBQ5939013.1 hypothetical protein [Massilia sp. AB1]MBQ5962436.1 hypothetical protein [Massilia sp. ZL223]
MKLDTFVPTAAELNERLLKRYTEVVEIGALRKLAAERDLSSLFVPAVSDSYATSKVRTMIVGRETAGWGSTLRKDLAHPDRMSSVRAYLDHQMQFHRRKVGTVAERSKFFQFYREAARTMAAPAERAARDAPVWANLFCFDAAKTRPVRGDDTASGEIVRLSGALLRVQLEVLRPQLIVFTTGSSCDRYLKQMFSGLAVSQVHIPKRIWEFTLPICNNAGGEERVTAFRTPHPRHAGSNRARSAILAEALAPGALADYLVSASAAVQVPAGHP